MSTESKPPARPPLFLTDADVAELSDLPAAIAAIRAAYSAPVDDRRNPGRIFADSTREWMRVMPSVPASGRLFGAKSINGSFADGLAVSYLISLFDKETADLVALIDGNRVTGLRTAATSAVGTEVIAPKRPLRVGVIGSGFEAQSHTTALSLVTRFASVRRIQPDPEEPRVFRRILHTEPSACRWMLSTRRSAPFGAPTSCCAPHDRGMRRPTLRADWVGDERDGRVHRLDHPRSTRASRRTHRARRARRRRRGRGGPARQRRHDRCARRGHRRRGASRPH